MNSIESCSVFQQNEFFFMLIFDQISLFMFIYSFMLLQHDCRQYVVVLNHIEISLVLCLAYHTDL